MPEVQVAMRRPELYAIWAAEIAGECMRSAARYMSMTQMCDVSVFV